MARMVGAGLTGCVRTAPRWLRAAGFYYRGFWQCGGETTTNRGIRQFLERLGDLSGLAPHDELVRSEQGRAWAQAEPAKRYLAYVEGSERIILETGRAEELVGQWFAPRTAEFGPKILLPAGAETEFRPPGQDDWVLWVHGGP